PFGFRQRPFFDQHHARPAPRAKLHAGRFLRDEKASSGLPLQPTDLPSLLTEQIAHFSPLLESAAPRVRSSRRCRWSAILTRRRLWTRLTSIRRVRETALRGRASCSIMTAYGTLRRFTGVPKLGRDRSEADMPRASGV